MTFIRFIRKIGILPHQRSEKLKPLSELLYKQRSFFDKEISTLQAIIYSGFSTIIISFIAFLIVEKYLTDPFVNLLDVNVGYQITNADIVETQDALEELGYVESLSSFSRESFRIRNMKSDSNAYDVFFGRTIAYKDSTRQKLDSIILNSVLTPSNLVIGEKKELMCRKLNQGIIVTERLLNDIGFTENSTHLYRWHEGGNNRDLAIPIVAVVQELPGRTDMMYTEKIWREYLSSEVDDLIFKRHPIRIFVPSEINSKFQAFFNEFISQDSTGLDPSILQPIDYEMADRGSLYKISLKVEPYISDGDKVEGFYKDLMLQTKTDMSESYKKLFRIYSKPDQADRVSSNDYLAIHLVPRTYASILSGEDYRELTTFLQNKGLDLDNSKIKRHKFLPRVLIVFIVLGLLFYVATISYLIKYLQIQVKKFLREFRKSYGQLKAVGVSDNDLENINLIVISSFLHEAIAGKMHFKMGEIRIHRLFGIVFLSVFLILIFTNKIVLGWTMIVAFLLSNVIGFFIASYIVLKSSEKEVKEFVQQDPGELIYAN